MGLLIIFHLRKWPCWSLVEGDTSALVHDHLEKTHYSVNIYTIADKNVTSKYWNASRYRLSTWKWNREHKSNGTYHNHPGQALMHVQVEQIVASDETIPEQSASVILLIRSPILESENTGKKWLFNNNKMYSLITVKESAKLHSFQKMSSKVLTLKRTTRDDTQGKAIHCSYG